MKTINENQNVPFFVKKLEGKALVVKTSVKAGATEELPTPPPWHNP
jgi:hypothetical protein